jgi:hypothetical protein
VKAREEIQKIIASIPQVRWATHPKEVLKAVPSGIPELDRVLGGGFPKGRISILYADGFASAGRFSIAIYTVSNITKAGGSVAWIDADGSLDPYLLKQYGADMRRILLVKGHMPQKKALKVLEEVVACNFFQIVVFSFLSWKNPLWNPSLSIRILKTIEKSRVALLLVSKGKPDGLLSNSCCVALPPLKPFFDERHRIFLGAFLDSPTFSTFLPYRASSTFYPIEGGKYG